MISAYQHIARRIGILALASALATVLAMASAPAEATSDVSLVSVRLSVKHVLDGNGQRSQGHLTDDERVHEAIGTTNAVLERNGARWRVEVVEIVDVPGASQFFNLFEFRDFYGLQTAARENPGAFAWRDDAINTYIVNDMLALGICAFPTGDDLITMNNTADYGENDIGVVWLHEFGHYFSLLHTFSCIGLDDCPETGCTGAGAWHDLPRGTVECPDNCPDDFNVMSYNSPSPQLAALSACQLQEMEFELFDPEGNRSNVLAGTAPPDLPETVTLRFNELVTQAVNGLTYRGVTFAYRIDGLPSTEAKYNRRGPGDLAFVSDPTLEGDMRGVLEIVFEAPTPELSFGLALSSREITNACEVELFAADGQSLGTSALPVHPLVGFAEGRFEYVGAPIGRVVIDFNEEAAARFALDNLTYVIGPEPARFVRGDVDGDASLTLTDGVAIFDALFLGQPDRVSCDAAADADGNGQTNLTDGVFVLEFLFRGGMSPPAPYPECGSDSSGLGCRNSPCPQGSGAAAFEPEGSAW